MASGDASRVSEMVDTLRRRWSGDRSWDELVELWDDLDRDLQRIRAERKILPPMLNCRACGKRHRAAPARVSVRALIFALDRFRVAPKAEVDELAKRWRTYRKASGLDRYGKREQKSGRPMTRHSGPKES